MRQLASCLIVALHLVLVARLDAQARPRRVDQFLTSTVHLDAGQLASLSRGDVIAKVLPTSLDRDVTVFAAAHVSASSAELVARQRDVNRTLHSPTRTAGGVFGTPATEADVSQIAITTDDVGELRKCKLNECNFKLPAADMERLHATIDWSSPDVTARVSDYVRQRMIEYVGDYRQRGDSAMVVYSDNGNVSASEALLAMLSDSSLAPSGTATLLRHLTDYPRDSLRGGTDIIFWSVDNLPHVRPILRITHETIYTPPELPGATIVSQQADLRRPLLRGGARAAGGRRRYDDRWRHATGVHAHRDTPLPIRSPSWRWTAQSPRTRDWWVARCIASGPRSPQA